MSLACVFGLCFWTHSFETVEQITRDRPFPQALLPAVLQNLAKPIALPEIQGLLIALAILGAWFSHLACFLPDSGFDVSSPERSGIVLIATIAVQTFLNTGLFVTAHDAIHGSVYPNHCSINHRVGALCAIAYAGLSYRMLALNHRLHHRHPMEASDPDFNDVINAGFWACYGRFIAQYWGVEQFLRLGGAIAAAMIILHFSLFNLIAFWGIPLFLSSLQLFYFGTYRPHQSLHRDRHVDLGTNSDVKLELTRPVLASDCSAKSDDFPWLISLLACYHFGYHQEHHDRPDVPWWRLPQVYRENF